MKKVSLTSFADYAKDFYPELTGKVNESEDTKKPKYQMQPGIPVFQGPDAYEAPKEYVEPNKAFATIKSYLAKGNVIGLTADVPFQKGLQEHQIEVSFNVVGFEGDLLKIKSAKKKRDYTIKDPKKIDEIFILEKPFNEEKKEEEVEADKECEKVYESFKEDTGSEMEEELKNFCEMLALNGKKSEVIMKMLGRGK